MAGAVDNGVITLKTKTAIARFLRVKYDTATAGQVEIAGDEAHIGTMRHAHRELDGGNGEQASVNTQGMRKYLVLYNGLCPRHNFLRRLQEFAAGLRSGRPTNSGGQAGTLFNLHHHTVADIRQHLTKQIEPGLQRRLC